MANTSKRGFASMDLEKQRLIASKGGKAAHQKGTAHEWSSEEARAAGRKGGESRGTRNRQASPVTAFNNANIVGATLNTGVNAGAVGLSASASTSAASTNSTSFLENAGSGLRSQNTNEWRATEIRNGNENYSSNNRYNENSAVRSTPAERVA